MAAEGVRLRPAADDADAAFIVEQMVASALEFAPPDQPFGIAETVRRPETALRWMESCRGKVQRSRAPRRRVLMLGWSAGPRRTQKCIGHLWGEVGKTALGGPKSWGRAIQTPANDAKFVG